MNLPMIVFACAVASLLAASAIPVKFRRTKNFDEYREMAKRKGISMVEMDQYVHPLLVPDRSVQITVQALISILILGACLIIFLSKDIDSTQKRWAYASAGTVLGFWLS